MKIDKIHAGYRVTVPGPIPYSSKQHSIDLEATVDEAENPVAAAEELHATAKDLVLKAAGDDIKAAQQKQAPSPPQVAPAAPSPAPAPAAPPAPSAPQAAPAQASASPGLQKEYADPPYGFWAETLGRIHRAMGLQPNDFRAKDVERNLIRHLGKYEKKDGSGWGGSMAATFTERVADKYPPTAKQYGWMMEQMHRFATMLENGESVPIQWTKWNRDMKRMELQDDMLTPSQAPPPQPQVVQTAEASDFPAPDSWQEDAANAAQDDIPF